MKKRQIPGLALVVIRDGQVTMMKGFGFANLEHDVPVHPDTVFELASTRNSSPRLPLWRLWNRANQSRGSDRSASVRISGRWKDITIRHLLTHTAGLPNVENGFQALKGGARLNYTTAQLFDAARNDVMNFAPGERWQYSDVGYRTRHGHRESERTKIP